MNNCRISIKALHLFLVMLLWQWWGCTGSSAPNSIPTSDKECIKFENTTTIDSNWAIDEVLVCQIKSDPPSLHPTNGHFSLRTFIYQYTQRMLVAYDPEMLILRPELLKELPKQLKDPHYIKYELRDDIYWDDGTPVSVEDVIFTYKANKCPLVQNLHAKTYFTALKDIFPDTKNKRIFVFKMAGSSVRNSGFSTGIPLLQRIKFDPDNILASFNFSDFNNNKIDFSSHSKLQKWAMEFNSDKYGHDPHYLSGLGPYQISLWESGQQLVLERKKNKNFRNNAIDKYNVSYPEKIIFKVIKDPFALLLSIRSQIIDAAFNLPEQVVTQLINDADFNLNYHIASLNTFSYTYLAMNMRPDGNRHKKIFTDKKVRKAMALLTPFDEIAKINKLYGKRMLSPVFPFSTEFDSSLTIPKYDFQQASDLLSLAGWVDNDHDGVREKMIDGKQLDLSFELSYPIGNSSTEKDIVLLIREFYAKAGIKVNLASMDKALLYKKAEKHDFDMMMGGWSADFLPPDFSETWHTASWLNNGSNYTGFGNSRTDSLIDYINTLSDMKSRLPSSHKLQQLIIDEQPYVFLFCDRNFMIAHKRFGNVEFFGHRPFMLLNNWNYLATNTALNQ